MKLRLVMALVAGLLVVAGTQAAQAKDPALDKARAAFEKAQKHYEDGQFAEAAKEFEAAYRAKAFPQFLFNIGASHEKLRDYAKAVEYYQRYIDATDNADDKKQTAKRIEVLKKEIERIKTKPPDAPEQSDEVKNLAEAKIRGVVVIISEPQGATIFLDSKEAKPLGRTPWNGTLEGEHRVFLVKEGYTTTESVVSPAPDGFIQLQVQMAQKDFLGFVEITSNVPKSDIYVDDKSQGVYQQTPWKGDLPPGKHKVWITKEGYDEYEAEITVVAGETQFVKATLTGGPVGYINVRGPETDQNKIFVDGKLLCERGPCRRPLREGAHKIKVTRGGHKSFTRNVNIQAKTEMTVYAKLAKKPGRGDAIVAFVVGAALAGGGLYALSNAQNIRDEVKKEIADGNPGVTQEDSRFTEARIWAAGGHAGVALGALSGAFAVYYLFRDKGPPSSGTVDVKAVSVSPQVTPGYAGVGVGGNF